MTLDEIDAFCRELPGCTVRYPFATAPDLRAWCIGKWMFAWTITTRAPLTVQIKANPNLVPVLISNYQSVSPGYHMNKRHWLSIDTTTCDDQLIQGLLEDAHGLIVASLPKAQRLSLSGNNGRA